MTFARYILSLCAWLLAFAALIVGWGAPGSIKNTIAHSREIEASFRQAAEFVDHHVQTTGVLPSKTQFDEWARSFPLKPYGINGMSLEVHPFSADVVNRFGKPGEGAYALVYWRGESYETYASWTGTSSLVFNESEYYMFDSRVAQAVLGLSVMIVAGISAYFLWPRRANAV